jgi:hypothetical protein
LAITRYACWKDKGSGMQFLSLPGLNHYEVVEAMVEQGGGLHEAIFELIKCNDTFSRCDYMTFKSVFEDFTNKGYAKKAGRFVLS